MTGIEKEIKKQKQQQAAKAATREAMKHESHQAADQDSRLKHYVEKEKSALKRDAKDAEANKELRHD